MTTTAFVGGRQATFHRFSICAGNPNAVTYPPPEYHRFQSLPLSQQLRIERRRGFDQFVEDAITTSWLPREGTFSLSTSKKQQYTRYHSHETSATAASQTKVEYYNAVPNEKRRLFTLTGGCFQKQRLCHSLRHQDAPSSRRYQSSTQTSSRSGQPVATRSTTPPKSSNPTFRTKAVPSRPMKVLSRVPQLVGKKDDMLIGVREGDRQRKAQIVGLNAIEIARRQLPKQLEARIDIFVSKTRLLAREIGKARLDVHLRPFHELDVELDLLTAMSKTWTMDLKDIYTAVLDRVDDLSLQAFIEVKSKPVEDSIYDIELEISKIHRDLSKIAAVTPRVIRMGAEAKIRIQDQEKGLTGRKRKLWNNIEALAITIIQIVQKLRELKARAARPHMSELRPLDQAYMVGVRLARPYADKWSSPIQEIAHLLRDIEMYKADADALPELMIAKRWASLTAHRYLWPLRDTSRELRGIFDVFPEEHNHLNHQPWTRRFRTLRNRVMVFTSNTDKITDMYSKLVCGGLSSLCPHPMREFHLKIVQAFRPFETFYQDWDDLMSEVSDARAAIIRSSKTYPASSQTELRAATVRVMEILLNPPQDPRHPLSRRGIKGALFKALVWHGAQLLTEGTQPNVPKNSTGAWLDKRGLVDTTSKSLKIPDMIMSGQWLKNKSLYPAGAPIMIDFVRGLSTFFQIIQEIRKQKVVSFDVITSQQSKASERTVDYFLLASPTNVYIIDPRSAIMRRETKVFIKTMETVLQNTSILKVCVNHQYLTALLWNQLTTSLRSVYDLQQHNLAVKHWTFGETMSLVERTFEAEDIFSEDIHPRLQFVKEKAPSKFFLYLAMRAYAPLRLFHALNKKVNVQTNDSTVSFNLGDYYDQLGRCEVNQLEFGPVNIDRSYGAFETVYKPIPDARKDTDIDLREAIMHDVSRTMAQSFLQKKMKSKLSHRSSKPIPDALYRHEMEQNIAAYYLFTTFGESLGSISKYLGCKHPGQCILWAADTYGLRLNIDDRARIGHAIDNAVPSQIAKALGEPRGYDRQIEKYICDEEVVVKQVKEKRRAQKKEPVRPDSNVPARPAERFKSVFAQNAKVQGNGGEQGGRSHAYGGIELVERVEQQPSLHGGQRVRSGGRVRARNVNTATSNEVRKTNLTIDNRPPAHTPTSPSSSVRMSEQEDLLHLQAKPMNVLPTNVSKVRRRQRRTKPPLTRKITILAPLTKL